MPAKLRTDKVADAITPLATRVARDPELREHAKAVLDSAKAVLDRVQSDGARSAATDRRVQDEVVKAAKELQQGASKLAATRPPASRKRRVVKAAAAGAVAVGAVIVAKKSMSRDEDEFEYTP